MDKVKGADGSDDVILGLDWATQGLGAHTDLGHLARRGGSRRECYGEELLMNCFR